MADLKCPHNCGITYDRGAAAQGVYNIGRDKSGGSDLPVFVHSYMCPKCGGVVVDLSVRESDHSVAPDKWQAQVWPKSGRSAPPEVPADIARDYNEAAVILADSPRASAALARRCLQHVLTAHLGATGGTLQKQIDSVGATVPAHVTDSLHALRQIGNFSAHPTKDQTTGDILDVEPGEAEWTLDVLDAMFEHAFVGPALTATRKSALNAKLSAAGKPNV